MVSLTAATEEMLFGLPQSLTVFALASIEVALEGSKAFRVTWLLDPSSSDFQFFSNSFGSVTRPWDCPPGVK